MNTITHKKGLIVFTCIIIITVLSLVISALNEKQFIPEHQQNEPGTTAQPELLKKSRKAPAVFQKSYIAALFIEGTIEDENKAYSQKWLLDTIDTLSSDTKNKAIMLFINSPGGGVYQADEVYLALVNYKKTTGRPVYAYLGPLAASGGYYIACAADSICANRNTLTGSIGVIAGQSIDMTGLLNKIGVKATTITAGKNKNMFNFNEPLSPEQKAIMQSVADDAYDQFTGIVAESRKMDISSVKTLADGRIYTAHQAVSNGLIDRICSWDDAIATLEHDMLNGTRMETETFRYDQKETLYDLLLGAATKIHGLTAGTPLLSPLERTALEHAVPDIPYPAYYYHAQ
jgi:protease IV